MESKHFLRTFFRNPHNFWVIVGVITALYFVLMSDTFFHLAPNEGYDDGLQFRLAQSLARGEWLGLYDNLTLSKGLTYPLWMAILHVFDIPFWFGNTLLYTLACLAVIYALRRAIHSHWVLLFVYSIILFNPFISDRAYRDAIAPALILMLFAWIIGMFLVIRADKNDRHRILDSIIFTITGALSLSAWWFLREDSFWILPFILLGIVVILWCLIYQIIKHKESFKRLIVPILFIILPLIVLAGSHIGIGLLNQHYYGRFVVNDYMSSDFQGAYGALTRIKDDRWQSTVPISENMRDKAYEVSPSFRKLKTCLDNEGKGVCEFFRYNNIKISNSDYEGGWFFWALRLAVQQEGYYDNPSKAADFYNKLASEINTACNTNKIECTKRERSSLSSPFRAEIITPFIINIQKSAIFLVKADGTGNSNFKLENIDKYSPEKEITADFLKARYHTGESNPTARIKHSIQHSIGDIYVFLNYIFFIGSLGSLIVMTIRIKVYKQLWPIVLIGWSIVFTIAIRVVMLAYVETTAFPAIITLYFSSTYPLMLLLEGIFVGLLISFLVKITRVKLHFK